MNFTTVLRIPLKTHVSLQEKWLSQAQPQPQPQLVSWCHKLMGEFFRLLWRNVNAYRKDRKCFKIVQTNYCFKPTTASHSLSTAYLRLLHSGIYGWTFQALWTSKPSCSYKKHCYRQKPPDGLHLMILEADLHFLVLMRGNLFDENCDGVQYFRNCFD